MNRVILIGNGFDLAHGLPTSYNHFLDWYWEMRGQSMMSSHNYVDDDSLSCFKLNSRQYTLYTYGCVNYIAQSGCSGQDFINHLKNNLNTCSVTYSPLAEVIMTAVHDRGWVDIENEYYKLLVASQKSNSLDVATAESINLQLEYLRTKLASYLRAVQKDPRYSSSWMRVIKEQMLQAVNPRDISVSSQQQLNEFIEERAGYSDKQWEDLLRSYNVFDLHDTMKEVKSVAEEVLSQKLKKTQPYKFRQFDIDNFLIPDKILLLNFNYTSVADSYLPKSQLFKVNHIHGTLEDTDSIIFGYGDELDKNYQILKEENENEYLKNMKSVRYLESDNYRKLLEFVNSGPFQIYIMGHSCGNSDRTLLNTLFEHDNCVSIKPFYYQKDDQSDNYLDIVQNISRNFTDMKKMRDWVVNKTYCEPLPQINAKE